MSANSRYLYGDRREISAPVHGNTVIEKGDLIVIMKTASTIKGVTTADNYAYPVSKLQDVSTVYYVDQLAGIAMKGSKSGVTENIPIATSGMFRMPLVSQTGVTVGLVVGGATSAAKVAYNQYANVKTTSTKIQGVTLGKCIKTEASATNVDFFLLTRFSGVTYSSIV